MCSELLCPLCDNSTFTDIESFKLNLIKVNSKPIKCPLCSEIVLGLDKLTIHLFAHSLPLETITTETTICQIQDNKTSDKNNFIKQQNVNKNLVNSTTSSSLLQKNDENDENFRCEICGFFFVEEQLLNLHLNLVHNFTLNDNSNENLESGNSIIEKNQINKWTCHLCGKHFKMKGALRIHVRVAHVRFHDLNQRHINIVDYLRNQKSIDMCTKQAENMSLKDPHSPKHVAISSPTSPSSHESQTKINNNDSTVAVKQQKSFQCEECKKTFTTKYFLKKHRRLHTGEYPYHCEVEGCGKMFHFQQSYHKHLLYHSDAKPYECLECGRSFKELSTLNNHQRIHSGIKPFGCLICGKFFRQKVSYLVHQRIHNGVLPYKCSECNKSFRYKVSQRSHKCNGVIERQPGSLIQKLMQNSLILPSSTSVSNKNVTNEILLMAPPLATTKTNISISNQEQHETSTITNNMNNDIIATEHELCLDELLKESYENLMKMNENENQHISQITDNGSFLTQATTLRNNMSGTTFGNNIVINSNYSQPIHNYNANFHSALETINEDSIKDLLYGNTI
ncbi:hypothetical protein PVAND_011777 [Polypedilum vanderplanki]|uniref:C2H2-type domain-containing protein n=1 Tax=Polypedilum vanderplanki TaxID=319348 RepID=A0A9J6CKH3_POLVA|nr:hypothetical protein PVAND_011777 [Polypedilum vanderplanki]